MSSVSARDLSLGYDAPLFADIDIDLREGEALELRGRNGAGKSTLHQDAARRVSTATVFDGELIARQQVRVGMYEQEVSHEYFELSLVDAIERMYLDKNLSISTTKIRQLTE